ncbi:uncharacterized protein LOC125946883 [Dermacentor silvarum]|uniref:uncharacterized protein LOC125946883 n=1 Tax=Dermacentor silvarum TaxID=543639 RepID=UPI002100DE15|nr:uncharacterized protein LOC125946883 [Dermacentor silvarum]
MGKYEHCSGAPQFLTFLLLLLLTFEATPCLGLREGLIPGGWTKQDPNFPVFEGAAKFAEWKAELQGGPQYRILRVLSAWTQIMNGINYRVRYMRVPKCRPDEGRRMCNHNEPPEKCLAIVHTPPYTYDMTVVEHSCIQLGGGGHYPPEVQTLPPQGYRK